MGEEEKYLPPSDGDVEGEKENCRSSSASACSNLANQATFESIQEISSSSERGAGATQDKTASLPVTTVTCSSPSEVANGNNGTEASAGADSNANCYLETQVITLDADEDQNEVVVSAAAGGWGNQAEEETQIVCELITEVERLSSDRPDADNSNCPIVNNNEVEIGDKESSFGVAQSESGIDGNQIEVANKESNTNREDDAEKGETIEVNTRSEPSIPNQEQERCGSQKSDNGEKQGEDEGVDCGFLVDRISCGPYQKALDRGEVPFCAFAPISTSDLYLLRIQDCSDTTRHMLVPASREEVFKTPGALKVMEEDGEPESEDTLNYRVPIVAIARQIYSEQEKQLVVSVDPLLKKDKKNISSVKFLTVDKFADFAFLGFDGNISEFAAKNEAANKENRRTTTTTSQQQSKSDELSVAYMQRKFKTPPKAPSRRGRGGRRRGVSRRSPRMPLSHQNQYRRYPSQGASSGNHMYAGTFQHSHLTQGSFVPSSTNSDGTFSVVHVNQGNLPPFPSFPHFQHSVPIGVGYVQDSFSVPLSTMMHTEYSVGMPVNEITVGTANPRVESATQQTNHDILTIAFDQLANLDGESYPGKSSQTTFRHNGSTRGGRRPGRKPGRKPFKEKSQNEARDSGTFGKLDSLVIPKRRGRPPKVRPPPPPTIPKPMPVQESDSSNMDGDDFDAFEKRPKLSGF